MDPTSYSEKRTRPTLEQRLESIISGAAQLADSMSTRDDTRDKIIASCNGVRQALQDLLSEYMNHVRIILHLMWHCYLVCYFYFELLHYY